MKIRIVVLSVTTLFLLLSLPVSVAQNNGKPAPVGYRLDSPAYGRHGPYWVGTQAITREAGTDPVDVRVWYPALNPSGVEEKIIYVMHWKWTGQGLTSDQLLLNVAGHALADAKVDLSAAPYPLVVFSHGWANEAVSYAWLLERIASYGFVVIAPDHKEIDSPDGADVPRSGVARPVTISKTIDYAATLTALNGALAGMIDVEKIAVAGHSAGGTTALLTAGARFDMVASTAPRACEDSDPEFMKQVAKFMGLDTVPNGIWPSLGDPRVDAVISMAGFAGIFCPKGVAEVTIPILVMGGTHDASVPPDIGLDLTYKSVSSKEKVYVGFVNGDHAIFSTSYEEAPNTVDVLGKNNYAMFSDAVWDLDRAHDITNHFVIAFLMGVLKGNQGAAYFLRPDIVNFTGINFDAQGF